MREWLIDMQRGPVQQWLESCPNHPDTQVDNLQQHCQPDTPNDETTQCDEMIEDATEILSDGSGSSAGSVWGVLGARRIDAESVLLSIGFGPTSKQTDHVRIPKRFLAPSKLRGVSTEQFIREEQQSDRMHDCGVFGYRGLTGNPHVPPSSIVAKIMERISSGDLTVECTTQVPGSMSVSNLRTTPVTRS